MTVLIRNDYHGPLPVCLPMLESVGQQLLQATNRAEQQLSLLITADPQIHTLNKTWRHKDKPTNVLSFPMEESGPGTMLGDIVISLDTAQREAQEKKTRLHNYLQSLLIHGFVHLLGLDHERSEQEADEMFFLEQRLAKQITERRTAMVQLAINVDHVATLRQARGITEPDPVTAAALAELAGAVGIVVHLREDRRHIQDRDVKLLRQTVQTKLNLEMGATEEIIAIALDIKPDMVTLVPEKRQELTTEGGLNVAGQKKKLTAAISRLQGAGIPVSLFIDPDSKQIQASKNVGATFVEIHTGRYADATSEAEQEEEFELVADAAQEAYEAGLRVNAGHGLNYVNAARVAAIPYIEELSIGHAVMARAIFVGISQAVREMKELFR